MKLHPLRQSLAAFAAFVATAGLAQAHPGHSAFDWTVIPHTGHESEHAFVFTLLALTAIGFVSYWVASRKR